MRENYVVWEWKGEVLERTPWGSNWQAAWYSLKFSYECGYRPWLEWRRY